jgi:hypothetical protein
MGAGVPGALTPPGATPRRCGGSVGAAPAQPGAGAYGFGATVFATARGGAGAPGVGGGCPPQKFAYDVAPGTPAGGAPYPPYHAAYGCPAAGLPAYGYCASADPYVPNGYAAYPPGVPGVAGVAGVAGAGAAGARAGWGAGAGTPGLTCSVRSSRSARGRVGGSVPRQPRVVVVAGRLRWSACSVAAEGVSAPAGASGSSEDTAA